MKNIYNINSRKKKRSIEKIQTVLAIFIMIAWFYIVWDIDKEVNNAEILSFNY